MTQGKDVKNSRKSEPGISIYGLCHPVTGELRYVGKAADIWRRLKTHMSESRKRKRPVNCWIASLAAQGMTPDIFEIERVSQDSWEEAEIHWIAYFKAIGANLLNLALGGDQPAPTKEQLAKAGRAAAKARDPDIFRLKKFMEGGLRVMRRFGDPQMIAQQEARIQMVSALTRDQQKRLAIEAFREPTEAERQRRVKKWRDSEEAYRAQTNAGRPGQDRPAIAVQSGGV